ncbi:MAG: hypothetical protein AB7O97_10675 [Planctomycetota bacterium]
MFPRPRRSIVPRAIAGAALAVAITAQDRPPVPAEPATDGVDLVAAVDAVRAEVATLCGGPFERPVPTARQTEDDMRAWSLRRVDDELGDGRLERLDAWLRCLQLLPADRSFRDAIAALLGSMTLGYYDSGTDRLYMLDRSAQLGLWYARFTAAHELTHAWDDQRIDLERLLRPGGADPTKDQLFARTAVVEGGAMAIADRWVGLHPPTEADLQQLEAATRADNARTMAAMAQAPRYCTLQLGKHTVGRAFFAAGQEHRPADAPPLSVAALAADLPASTEQLLHPEKYWDAEQRDPPIELVTGDSVAARIAEQTGLRVLEQTTLGEMITALLALPPEHRLRLGPHREVAYWTNPAAAGWGGDRLFVLGAGGGTAGVAVERPGVVWVTAWDTEADRAEFVEALARHRGPIDGHVAARGRAAAFAFGSARSLDADALGAVLERCRFRHGAADWQP